MAALSALALCASRLRALRACPLYHLGASASHPWAPAAVTVSLKSNFHNTTQCWVMFISCSWPALMGNITHGLEIGQEISIIFTDFNTSHKLALNSLFSLHKLREQTQTRGSPKISSNTWQPFPVRELLHMWVCGLRFGLKNVLFLRSWIFMQLPDQSYSCLKPQIKCGFLFISVLQANIKFCPSHSSNKEYLCLPKKISPVGAQMEQE